MTRIVDASVAFKWFVIESGSQLAAGLLDGHQKLIAPELVIAELLNAMWKGLRRQTIDKDQFRHTASHAPAFFDELVPLRALSIRAASLAQALDHPIYDCFYLALAEREGIPLITADQRLLARLVGTPWQQHACDLTTLALDM
jgi:predicted nucleic acid-binding protein